MCAETDFDPSPVVARVPEDRTLEVLAALRTSEAVGVDRIAELIWERRPGDPRVLALVPAVRARSSTACGRSSGRRACATADMGRLCPLVERAEDARVDAPERARAAALAHASFGDGRAREALERTVPHLTDEELSTVLGEVWSLAGMLADSVVVAGATTPKRALLIAATLYTGGARDEAYAVLVHGLSMEAAQDLTTELVVKCLPLRVLQGLAHEAEMRGEEDVAGILEAVAVVAADG